MWCHDRLLLVSISICIKHRRIIYHQSSSINLAGEDFFLIDSLTLEIEQ